MRAFPTRLGTVGASGADPAERAYLLSRWAGSLSCHTAALAVWLAARHERWWRPLLAGTPLLAITPQPDGLVRFEHHPRPPLEVLGLAPRHADDWATARGAYRRELADSGALVVCGDAYNLPWQRGYRRWHAPYWFTVLVDGGRWLIEDPLATNAPNGPRTLRRVPVEPGQLMQWSVAPQSYTAIQHLRELSIVGYGPPGLGVRYRWLARTPAPHPGRAEPTRLVGADAVNGLAIRFRVAPPDDPIHRQADDLWQALRQRELVVAAGEVDRELVPGAIREHWRRAVAGWRHIVPPLMQARSTTGSGPPGDPRQLADAVAAVAQFEADEWRLAGDCDVLAVA
ncbi:hypothetical protein [Rhizomonospora bruguierae]|uniref:hypothetical protein n=1 Tax=Rhizomonospora bruguierae TaxID=1581705 RepID=UPI001BCC1BC2|nr:hypothetical protein [Micromonospora sp. NBRC 107566]